MKLGRPEPWTYPDSWRRQELRHEIAMWLVVSCVLILTGLAVLKALLGSDKHVEPSIRIEVERMAQEVYDRTAAPFFVRETKENANAGAGASCAAYPANTDGGATC